MLHKLNLMHKKKEKIVPCAHAYVYFFRVATHQKDRGRRNLDKSIHNENHWPQLLYVSDVECQIDCFANFEAYFSCSLKENAFQNLEENLWTINQKTEFPDFSLTLTIAKIFPDFLKNSPTFPWPWKIFGFPWLFPDCGNPVLAMLSRKIEDS